MKRGSTIFLRAVVLLIGLTVLALCLFVLPVGLRGDASGYYRPIILGMYITAVPFFIALYQTLKLLNYIDQNKAFSQFSVDTLRHIKYCAVVIGILFAVGLPYGYFAGSQNNTSVVITLGLVVTFASIVIATFAAVLQKILTDAIAIKSENDLTV